MSTTNKKAITSQTPVNDGELASLLGLAIAEAKNLKSYIRGAVESSGLDVRYTAVHHRNTDELNSLVCNVRERRQELHGLVPKDADRLVKTIAMQFHYTRVYSFKRAEVGNIDKRQKTSLSVASVLHQKSPSGKATPSRPRLSKRRDSGPNDNTAPMGRSIGTSTSALRCRSHSARRATAPRVDSGPSRYPEHRSSTVPDGHVDAVDKMVGIPTAPYARFDAPGLRPLAEILTLSGCTTQEDLDVIDDLCESRRVKLITMLSKRHNIPLKDYQVFMFGRSAPINGPVTQPRLPGGTNRPLETRYHRPAFRGVVEMMTLAGLDQQSGLDVFDSLDDDTAVDMLICLSKKYGIGIKDHLPFVVAYMRKTSPVD
ncbi:hypothetical protein NMY22_g19164 [Coprinellus aureogranulatus]|nr:hypothetical protein NMY22_g19164 [Coprinellus aureogranulatus]